MIAKFPQKIVVVKFILILCFLFFYSLSCFISFEVGWSIQIQEVLIQAIKCLLKRVWNGFENIPSLVQNVHGNLKRMNFCFEISLIDEIFFFFLEFTWRPIEKYQGCPHVVCKMCSFSFCWICFREFEKNVHSNCYDQNREYNTKQKKEESKILKGKDGRPKNINASFNSLLYYFGQSYFKATIQKAIDRASKVKSKEHRLFFQELIRYTSLVSEN